jgi:hypothetical protein
MSRWTSLQEPMISEWWWAINKRIIVPGLTKIVWPVTSPMNGLLSMPTQTATSHNPAGGMIRFKPSNTNSIKDFTPISLMITDRTSKNLISSIKSYQMFTYRCGISKMTVQPQKLQILPLPQNLPHPQVLPQVGMLDCFRNSVEFKLGPLE